MLNSEYTTPIPSLDGIRAVAVTIVILAHAGFGDVVPGGLGVTIFFFLSGYLITTLLCKEYELRYCVNVKAFYIRRFLRLFPPLLVCLLISYSLVYFDWLGGDISILGFMAQLLYFANYYMIFFDAPIPNGTGILWSLAVEEHYYIFFPLLIAPLFRRFRRRQIGIFLLFFCGLALFWRMYLASQPDFQPDRTYYASDTRFDSILFGSVLALIKNPTRYASNNIQTMKLVHWSLLMLGILGITGSLVLRGEYFRETFRYTMQGLSLLPIFYCAVRFSKSMPFAFLNTKAFKRIGVLSYSIYLIHLILIYAIQKLNDNLFNPIFLFFIIFLISTGYAKVIEKYIEIPLLIIRKRVR